MRKTLRSLVLAAALLLGFGAQAQTQVPYFENFDSYTGTALATAGPMPTGWSSWHNSIFGNAAAAHIGSGSDVHYNSASNALLMTSDQGGTTGIFNTPKIVALPAFSEPISNLRISFWFCTDGWNADHGTFAVGYITTDSITSMTNFVAVSSISTSQASYYGNGGGFFDTVDLSSVPATARRIALRWACSDNMFRSCFVDDVLVTTINDPCHTPVVDTIEAGLNSATVFWSGDSSNYEIAIKPSNDSAWNAAIAITDTNYTFNGLTPGTNYDIRLRMMCDTNFFSDWTVWTFSTDALPPTPATIVVTSHDAVMGSVTPTDTLYLFAGDTLRTTATPNSGHLFDHWSSSYGYEAFTDNPLVTVVPEAWIGELIEISAWFTQIPVNHTLTISCNNDDLGWVGVRIDNGDDTYTYYEGSATHEFLENTVLAIYAESYGDDCFVAWNDDDNNNPRTITLTRDTVFTAYFYQEPAEGIGSVEGELTASLTPNPANGTTTLNLSGVDGTATIAVVDLNGRTVMGLECQGNSTQVLNLAGLAQGTYFVRIVCNTANTVKKLIVR